MGRERGGKGRDGESHPPESSSQDDSHLRSVAESTRSEAGETSAPEERPLPRLWVEDAGKRRPFMRGIMIHSLMARGVSFEEADRAATAVRARLCTRRVVGKPEIVSEIRKILGDAPFESEQQLPSPVDIVIQGKGRGQPFSKGVLSQSLLAAAIEPSDAFDVAREIERDLLRRRLREMHRSDLRRLAYEALKRRMGEQAAERYLVWREFQEPQRPVILLLGGAAGVGKTSLALEVAHRLGIGRVLSSDSVRQIMRIMLSPELAPAIHGSSYDAYKRFPPGTLGSDPVIEGFRAQTATVSVGIRASMDRAMAENTNLIVDGVALVPGLIDPSAYAELAHVVFLVVATLDTEAYAARFASRAEEQAHRPAHHYVENLQAILRIQDHLLDAAERFGVPIVDNESFDRAVLLIIRHVTETLRKREGREPGAQL
jgi:2-phosphoglycerate kinase